MRRWRHGLYVRVQRYREGIADRADSRLFRLGVPVELIRRAKEIVSFGHGHPREPQPAAAMCH